MSAPVTQLDEGRTEDLRFRRYRLTPRGPASVGRPLVVDRRLVHVGSAPDADLVLDDPTVSRHHARLEFDRNGYRLVDLGSKNGTAVDGVRVQDAYVTDGATLRFGRADVAFELEDVTIQVALARGERFGPMWGRSAAMREIFAQLGKIALSAAHVWLEGEAGSGKELAAEAIHQRSARRQGPLVTVDVAAVGPSDVERELFGAGGQSGRLEAARGGTLVLDGADSLPPEVQARLLRALEGRELLVAPAAPAGHTPTAPQAADVRVVATSEATVEQLQASGRVRTDLIYTLAVLRARLPPLRHRPEDVPLLVERALADLGAEHVAVSWQTMERLKAHPWPGNVRELRAYVARAVALSEQGALETRHLDALQGAARAASVDGEPAPSGTASTRGAALEVAWELPFKDAKARLVDAFERRYWLTLLEASGGNVSEAARRGGIHRKSLEYTLKKLDRQAEEP